MPVTGDRFGRYTLLRRLAVGGMAEIYLASGAGDEGRPVVVKRLHRHLSEDDKFVRMFLDEARLAVRLDHPGICRLFDLGCERGDYYLAMEYVAGVDLEQLIEAALRSGMPIPPAIAARLCADLCEALSYAHSRTDRGGAPLQIVHRDVTPSNVIVTTDGTVKLCDFGIAKAAVSSESTQAGVLKGKFRYMSPEQARGRPVDRRTDLFAVGVMLYELTLGAGPFDRPDDASVLRAVVMEPARPPREVRPGYPAALERIILKALAKRVEQRHQQAGELREELERYLAGTGAPIGAREVAAYGRAVGALRDGESLEEVTLSGLGGAITLPPSIRVGAQRPPPIFVGREEELVRLLAAAQVARRGARGVLLVGQEGMGRTRLLTELAGRLTSRGYRTLRAAPGAGGGAYDAIEQLLRELAGAEGPSGEAAARLTGIARDLLGDEAGPGAAALAGHLVGLPFDDHPAVRLFRGQEPLFRGRACAAVKELLGAAAARAPLALLLDDADLAEAPTLDLLEGLLASLGDAPVLVVVAASPWLRELRPAAFPGAEELELGELGAASLRAMTMSAGLSQEASDAVATFSEGNPLAVVELIRLLGEGVEPEELPLGLAATLRARAERLTGVEREALARAAILRDPVRRGDVLEVGSEAAAAALERLVERGILEGVAPGEYRFSRPAWRDLADSSLPPAEKQSLHRLVAERLMARGLPGDLRAGAAHLERAGEPRRAAAAFLAAGHRARDRFAPREAAELYEQALRLADQPRARYAIASFLEQAYSALGERVPQLAMVEELARLATGLGAAEQAEVRLTRLNYEARTGDPATVIELAHEVIAAKVALGDRRGEGVALVALAKAYLRTSRMEEASVAIARSMRLAERLGDNWLRAEVSSNAGTLRVMKGDFPRAVRCFHRAVDLCNKAGEARLGATGLSNLAEAYQFLGDLGQALPMREKALELVRAVGFRWGEAFTLLNLANTYRLAGRVNEAVTTAREAVVALDAVQDSHHAAFARAYLALCHLARGEDGDEALAKAAAWDAVEVARRLGNVTAEVEGLTAASVAELLLGDLERAAAASRRAYELVISRGPLLEFEPDALYHHHMVMRRAGSEEEAEGALRQAYERIHAAAGRIRDVAMRDRFLSRVPINAAIIAAWRRRARPA